MKYSGLLLITICLFLLFSACGTAKRTNQKPTKRTSDNPVSACAEKIGVSYTGQENPELYRCLVGWLGVPYKYGGCDKTGTDCSCFVKTVYYQIYKKKLSRTASDICKLNVKKISTSELKEGDLVFFNINKSKPSHVGIYLKESKFVHASTSKGVVVSSLNNSYYKKYFYMAGRVM